MFCIDGTRETEMQPLVDAIRTNQITQAYKLAKKERAQAFNRRHHKPSASYQRWAKKANRENAAAKKRNQEAHK